MTSAALETLQRVGQQLDSNIYPTVHNGGFVMPRETSVPDNRGEVKNHERQRQRTNRPATGPWQGTAGGQGPSSGTSPLFSSELQTQYESELDAVLEAYPKTHYWKQAEGMILLTESALLNDLDRKAIFLVAVPYSKRLIVKSWGFWGVSSIGVEWIGPRHTNFPDGSICAFEPNDRTWKIGDSIVKLLDFYSLWALRHLHLREFGRWPGHQAAPNPYERILELRPDEYCGCEHSERLYGECCQPKDLQCNRISAALNYIRRYHGGHRLPPTVVTNFALNRTNPPTIRELLQVC